MLSRSMKGHGRFLLLVVGALLLLAPIALVLTILLIPLWSWIEATYGIESIGHSGPADWCFEAVYALLAAGAGALWIARRRAR